MKPLLTLSVVSLVLVASVAAQEPVATSLPGLEPPTPPKSLTPAGDDDNRAVRQALEKRIDLQFEDVALQEVVRRVARDLDVTVLLDPEGLDEAGVVPDQLITFKVPGGRARNALRLLLGPLHLKTVVRDGVLQITSEEKASEMLGTRVYNVRDLIMTGGKSGGGGPLPVLEGAKVMYRRDEVWQDFDTLIDLITSTIEPDTWTDNGGSGSISGYPRGSLLVISQTDDIHEDIQHLLDMMRAAADKVGVTLPER